MKRFYKTVDVVERGGAFEVRLDGKPVRTPLKSVLALPTRALAEAISEEWKSRGETFDPAAMPLTRLANATADRGQEHAAGIADNILKYGASDLLCYRAEDPELAAKQAGKWDPILDWLKDRYGVRLAITTGLTPIDQGACSLTLLKETVMRADASTLSALYAAVGLLGSLVLALALIDGRLTAAEAFSLSRLDEDHQAQRWGKDREATERAARAFAELEAAHEFLRLSRA